MSDTRQTVLGIGNAIVDVIAEADDRFLDEHGLVKGSMALIDDAQAERLYERMSGGKVERSGGSAANTIAGIASLGGHARYIGKLKDDRLGRVFREDMREIGVGFDTPAAVDGPATARCLVFVTADAERTMQTYLGASATLAPEDVDAEAVRDASITYLEGYLFDPEPARKAFFQAAELAHAAGRRIALSLSDRFCVDRHRAALLEFVESHVDVLFANEGEIVALYEAADLESALAGVRGHCAIAALTRGAQGAVVLDGQRVVEIPAEPVERVVDTTGAGDLYAAGFLKGLADGRDVSVCGRMGAIAAAEVISHYGARPETSLERLVAERLRR